MAHIPRIVCLTCKREMAPDKNGVRALSHSARGPYYVVMADRWRCELCGQTVLLGFGHGPVAEHFQGDLFDLEKNQADHEFVFRSERYPLDSLPAVVQALPVLESAIEELELRLRRLRGRHREAEQSWERLIEGVKADDMLEARAQ